MAVTAFLQLAGVLLLASQPDSAPSIHAQGSIEIPRLCAVDIDEGKCTCTIELDGRGTVPPARDADSDFWIKTTVRGAVYPSPRNGARISLSLPVDGSKEGCFSAPYASKPVRIDGLPPGSRVCVHTNQGRYAQLTFSDVVEPGSDKVRVAFITWRGPPEGAKLRKGRGK